MSRLTRASARLCAATQASKPAPKPSAHRQWPAPARAGGAANDQSAPIVTASPSTESKRWTSRRT
jgi:hypothetical protein